MFFHFTEWRHWFLSVLVDQKEFVSGSSGIKIIERQKYEATDHVTVQHKREECIKEWFSTWVWNEWVLF